MAKDKEITPNKTAKVTAVFETKKVEKKPEVEPKKQPAKKVVKQQKTVKKSSKNIAFSLTENKEEYTITNRQLQTGILTRAKNFVSKRYENQKVWYNLAFVALNILVVVGILIFQQNTMGVLSFSDFLVAHNAKLSYLWYAVLVFAIIMLLESLRSYVFLHKATKRRHPILSYKSSVKAKYYDSLIPIVGGKPFEVFYLYKKGIKASAATSVPVSKYLFNMLATIILSTVVIVAKWSFLRETNQLILTIGIIMLVVNLLITAGLVMFSASKTWAPKLMYKLFVFLEKIHLLKNHKQTFYHAMRFVLEYQKSVEFYLKSKKTAVFSLLISLAISLLQAVLPFVVYAVFAAPTQGVLLQMMFHYYILLIAINYVPLPSGTGVTEFAFLALFSTYFVDGTLFWALLIWRFFSYYSYILQGLIMLVLDWITDAIKGKRKAKQDANQLAADQAK